jgi:putative DNA primase/helicase
VSEVSIRWTDLPIEPHHAAYLEAHGVKPEWVSRLGIRSITSADDLAQFNGQAESYWSGMLPALIYPWRYGEITELQIAPDNREKFKRYYFREGATAIPNEVRENGDEGPVILAEGSKQQLVAAEYAPEEYSIYGIAGCWNWTAADLSRFAFRDVVVIFDGDMKRNRDVWDAAQQLQETLDMYGAMSIKFVSLPTTGTDGLDDLLARTKDDDTRRRMLDNLISKAGSLGKAPAKKASKKSGVFFDDHGSLLVQTLAKSIYDEAPLLLTPEQKVAAYAGGVYRLDGLGVLSIITRLLGEDYRPAHRAAVEDVLAGRLNEAGLLAPTWMTEPYLNCANGMLDLRTGELKPHSPDYLSLVQIPIAYDPDATCPTYESWLESVVGDQADALEEIASTMLDPTRTPTKALFAFGPSRSGKSTFLRILKAIAGDQNTSGVTLQQLSDDKFAAANLYGMMLNVGADLSNREVSDLQLFKMMTGVDPIHANRKYGKQFGFTNRALFGFSANELPQVSEGSSAYRNRVKPVKFPNSFADAEDQRIEDQIMTELPGVLARLVKAYRAHAERGHRYLETDPQIMEEFDQGSDRVRMWVAEEMEIWPAERADMEMPAGQFSTATELTGQFNQWATRNHGSNMGRNTLKGRLTSIDGVMEVRGPDRSRGLNVSKRVNRPGSSGTSETSSPMHNLKKRHEPSPRDLPTTTYTRMGEDAPEVPELPGNERDTPEHLWTTLDM